MIMICNACERVDNLFTGWVCAECYKELKRKNAELLKRARNAEIGESELAIQRIGRNVRLEELERENERLEKALRKIAFPIVALQKEAEETGAKLDGGAASRLSDDASWLKSIAKQAMDKELMTTWIDLVRKHFPGATIGEADHILWEKTSFPCGRAEEIERQLKELAEREG